MGRRGVLAAILVIAAVVGLGGISYVAYNQGLAQGAAHSTSVETGNGSTVAPVPPHIDRGWYGYGYAYPWAGPFGGFAFFGLLKLLFFATLLFLVVRWFAWGGRRHGPWGGSPPGDRLEAWHKQAHADQNEPQS